MGIETAVRQVALVGGRRYDQVAGILAGDQATRSAKRSRGVLYVLVEVLEGATGRDLMANRLAWVMRDAYYRQRGSVTAGLKQAIQEANNLLFEENRNVLPGERAMAGVSCAVLREQDLFIAQAGPAALFVAEQGQVTRFPETSPWLDDAPLEEVDAAPLGRRRDLAIDLFHRPMRGDETILLIDSGTARRAHHGAWEDALGAASAEEVLQDVLIAGRGLDLSALVIRLGEKGGRQYLAQPAKPTGKPALEQTSAPIPQREELAAADHGIDAGRILRGAAGAVLAFLKQMVPSQTKPVVAPPKPTAPSKKTRLPQEEVSISERVPQPRGSLVQGLILVAAVAIPLAVAALVLFTLVQDRQTEKTQVASLWAESQSHWNEANLTGDQAAIRTALTEAQQSLDRLLDLQPDHPEALELRQKIDARLEESRQVRRVHWAGALRSYAAGAKLTRVIVQGLNVFVLDRNANQVYHHQLDEFQQSLQPEDSDRVVVRKGDRVKGVLVNDLVDMTWMPVGNGRQKAGLVILESGSALLEYDPATQSLTALRVAATDTWVFPKLIGGHSGRFYLLDPAANKIWRYTPTPDGYSDPPDNWLQAEMDLAGVVDMAIGSSIYLLFADGKIERLSTGKPDAFGISDWDISPAGATAVFARPPEEARWVYVADPGNRRIVQCSKEGLFARQYWLAESQAGGGGDALAGIASLFVDEKGFRGPHAYFTSGNQLHMIILPEVTE